MKFDKVTIAGFAVCIAFLFAWEPFCLYMGWIKPPKPVSAVQAAAPQEAVKPVTVTTVAGKDTAPALPTKFSPVKKYQPIELQNEDVKVTIDPNTGIIADIQLKKFLNNDKKTLVSFKESLPPGTLAIKDSVDWEPLAVTIGKTDAASCSLSRIFARNGQKFELEQNWSLQKDYQILYSVTIKNLSKEDLNLKGLSLQTGSLTSLLYQTGENIRTEIHNVDCFSDKLHSISADAEQKDFVLSITSPIKWIGVSNKYFACLIKPATPDKNVFSGIEPLRKENTVIANGATVMHHTVAAAGKFQDLVLAPGNTMLNSYIYFNGPKELSYLNQFDPEAKSILHLSIISPMEWISRQLLVFLVWLKSLCGSYGLSIIFLTIIVRLIFWPVTQKANTSMKKMQKLQPLVKELKEKYKDNQQLMNTKMMELYREQKVNPLGGCLPILLQIPVFIALYSTIDSAVELRHISFLWAKDLTQPDTVAVILGTLPINPLIIVMTLLMVLQQRMTPAAADPMQQKIMMLMPVVMLFILYTLPAGLTLYWTVSQIFSIIQLLLTPKDKTATPVKTS